MIIIKEITSENKKKLVLNLKQRIMPCAFPDISYTRRTS